MEYSVPPVTIAFFSIDRLVLPPEISTICANFLQQIANSLRMKELGDIWNPQKIFGRCIMHLPTAQATSFSVEDSLQLLVY